MGSDIVIMVLEREGSRTQYGPDNRASLPSQACWTRAYHANSREETLTDNSLLADGYPLVPKPRPLVPKLRLGTPLQETLFLVIRPQRSILGRARLPPSRAWVRDDDHQRATLRESIVRMRVLAPRHEPSACGSAGASPSQCCHQQRTPMNANSTEWKLSLIQPTANHHNRHNQTTHAQFLHHDAISTHRSHRRQAGATMSSLTAA